MCMYNTDHVQCIPDIDKGVALSVIFTCPGFCLVVINSGFVGQPIFPSLPPSPFRVHMRNPGKKRAGSRD